MSKKAIICSGFFPDIAIIWLIPLCLHGLQPRYISDNFPYRRLYISPHVSLMMLFYIIHIYYISHFLFILIVRWQPFGVESSFPPEFCTLVGSFPLSESTYYLFPFFGYITYSGQHVTFSKTCRTLIYDQVSNIPLNIRVMWIAVSHSSCVVLQEHRIGYNSLVSSVILAGGIQRYGPPVHDNG